MAASALYRPTAKKIVYYDQKGYSSAAEFRAALGESATVYVGNLSFYTTDAQVHALFRRCGDVRRVVMGLHRTNLTPCGFCFVEYFRPCDACDAVAALNNTRLDDRAIRVDRDPGFKEGRQYGRGRTGCQIRDEFRETFDPARPAASTPQPQQQSQQQQQQSPYYYPQRQYPASEPHRVSKRPREESAYGAMEPSPPHTRSRM